MPIRRRFSLSRRLPFANWTPNVQPVRQRPGRLQHRAVKRQRQAAPAILALRSRHVEVTLEIQARVEGGIPDNIARTVSENCKTLKFLTQGFEKD